MGDQPPAQLALRSSASLSLFVVMSGLIILIIYFFVCHQGRMMIHQMMLLMHLEMQLRQQAFTSYQAAHDPRQRLQRLDDVLALNEQLNEVGSILSAMLSVPVVRRPGTTTPGTGRESALGPPSRLLRRSQQASARLDAESYEDGEDVDLFEDATS